ncbi:hypothetical protein KIW84_050636, partial [Lathyrus oleraceus]
SHLFNHFNSLPPFPLPKTHTFTAHHVTSTFPQLTLFSLFFLNSFAMDPCPFVRLTIGNLALKIPVASKAARSVVHPSSSPCFCKIKLNNFPVQSAQVPFIPHENHSPDSQIQPIAATFHLSKADLDKLAGKSIFVKKLCLKISIYTGRSGTTCGVNSGRLLGKVSVPLSLSGAVAKATVFHNGWITVGKDAKGASAQFHLNVKAEPDPRFVFRLSEAFYFY